MAMTTRATRGSNMWMQGVTKLNGIAPSEPKPEPLFPGAPLVTGVMYRLPIKTGSRGKGTRLR